MIEHLVHTEGLHVAIAFEQVAVDLVGDPFRHTLESRSDRSFDGEAGVVGDQPDDRHRDEAEQDDQRRQFCGDPPMNGRMFFRRHDRCPFRIA